MLTVLALESMSVCAYMHAYVGMCLCIYMFI